MLVFDITNQQGNFLPGLMQHCQITKEIRLAKTNLLYTLAPTSLVLIFSNQHKLSEPQKSIYCILLLIHCTKLRFKPFVCQDCFTAFYMYAVKLVN